MTNLSIQAKFLADALELFLRADSRCEFTINSLGEKLILEAVDFDTIKIATASGDVCDFFLHTMALFAGCIRDFNEMQAYFIVGNPAHRIKSHAEWIAATNR